MYQTTNFLDDFKYSNFEDYKQLSKKKGIYLIRNVINNNLYVGSTVSKLGIRDRISQHYFDIKSRGHKNCYLQNSINKHGINNFKISILLETDTLTNTKIRELEKEYIDYYRTIFKLFNMRDPVDLSMSEEVKHRMSKSKRKLTTKINQGILYLNDKYKVRIKRNNNNAEILYGLGTYDTLDEAVNIYRNYFDKDSSEIETYITELTLNKLKNTKTGYFGVSYHPRCKTNPYCAKVIVNNNRMHLGVFATAKEAAIAYNNYLIEHNLVTYYRPLNIIKED